MRPEHPTKSSWASQRPKRYRIGSLKSLNYRTRGGMSQKYHIDNILGKRVPKNTPMVGPQNGMTS
jgi:hypothetical protein